MLAWVQIFQFCPRVVSLPCIQDAIILFYPHLRDSVLAKKLSLQPPLVIRLVRCLLYLSRSRMYL